MICVISYTPSPDRRQDRTRVFDRTIVYRPRRQRPELRPRDDRHATKRGPLHARRRLPYLYRWYNLSVYEPQVYCTLKAQSRWEMRGRQSSFIAPSSSAEQHERSPFSALHGALLRMAPRALLTRLLTKLLSSRIARRCARARFHMQHATYTCTGPRSGVAPACMQDPCKCSPQRSTCSGGRVALGSALRPPRAPGSRPAPPHPRPPRALAPWASWRV